ncbi:MAG: hypothetical protein F6K58_11990 [Symploca sp. SIO2E9]|nr:hypothetical protein [Symploca sp. SIO2E9]
MSQHLGSYLILVAPNGNVIAKNYSNKRALSAQILQKLPETGTYTVIANTSKPGDSGSYRLRLTTPMLVEKGAIHQGTPVCFSKKQRCYEYQFLGQTNQNVTIFLNSEFSPFLRLVDPNGEVIAQGTTELKDVLSVNLPNQGKYRLIVSNVNLQDRGKFFLSVHDTEDLVRTEAISKR